MENIESVLEEKGYGNIEIMEIISANEKSLDVQTREYFGLQDQPLHLLEAYYIGDADEDILEAKAKEFDFEDIHDLLKNMGYFLFSLAEKYETKKQKELYSMFPFNNIYFQNESNFKMDERWYQENESDWYEAEFDDIELEDGTIFIAQ